MFKEIKKLLIFSCILFTAFVFILYVAATLISSQPLTMTLKSNILLFFCSFILCIIHKLFGVKKLPLAIRVLLHYITVLAAAYIGFVLIARITTTSVASLVLLSAVTLVYTIGALVAYLVSRKSNQNSSGEYKSMFKE